MKDAYLVLLQVVGQVGDHDLSLGRNTILWRTTLLALPEYMGLSGFSWVNRSSYLSSLLSCKCFVRGLGEWDRYIRWYAVSRGSSFNLSVFGMFGALGAFLVLSVH